MAPHDPAADVLEACRTDLHVLAPETSPCGGIRAVVRYLASLGKRAISVGRATVTVEQLDVRRWPTRESVATARRVPPFGWCHNPLLLRFYDDPDVWTLSFDEGDAFASDDDSPPPALIRAHQEALILHGGRYGLYEVYRIHNPDEPPEAWRWEKLAFLGPEEVRERILGDLRRDQGFDGFYRQVVERTERGGIRYRMVRDPELESLAGAMRELCEHYLARLATLEEPFHRAHHQDETASPPPES